MLLKHCSKEIHTIHFSIFYSDEKDWVSHKPQQTPLVTTPDNMDDWPQLGG
jgi:hypothetical protein